jgi:diguanylate cyclase (GGDEF)-like protein/PAS domain S-box-containing protein
VEDVAGVIEGWRGQDVLIRALRDSPIGTGVTDAEGRLVFVNPALCSFLASTEPELLGTAVIDIARTETLASDIDLTDGALRGLALNRIIKRFSLRDGSEVVADVALTFVRDEDQVLRYVIVQLVDITAREQDWAELQALADTDPLTGLLNRRALAEKVAAVPDREERRGELLAVLYCDLDGLKGINDRYGHHVGDTVLQAVATRMCGAVRAGDLVARVGGDEFVLVLNGVRDDAAAIATAEKVASRVSRELRIDGSVLLPTLSIGIAMADDAAGLDRAMQRADQALYDQKRDDSRLMGRRVGQAESSLDPDVR